MHSSLYTRIYSCTHFITSVLAKRNESEGHKRGVNMQASTCVRGKLRKENPLNSNLIECCATLAAIADAATAVAATAVAATTTTNNNNNMQLAKITVNKDKCTAIK